MLSTVLLTVGVLIAIAALLVLAGWLGVRCNSTFIAERVHIELEQRASERELQRIADAAMRRLVDEARRGPAEPWR